MSIIGESSIAHRGLIFDTLAFVTPKRARDMQAIGCGGAIRYVKRDRGVTDDASTNGGTLTRAEYAGIMGVGCAVMPVQLGRQNLEPTAGYGEWLGDNAVHNARDLGFPRDVTMCVDVEDVTPSATEQDVIDYINAWADRVKAGGYQPGLYNGPGSKLTEDRLFRSLRLTRYWASATAVKSVAERGYGLVQMSSTSPAGFPVDMNAHRIDGKGERFMWAQPPNWINPHPTKEA